MGKIISIALLGLALAGCSLPEPTYFVGEKTDTEALTDCQMEIRKSLKVPNSMDVEYANIHYLAPPEKTNHEVWFQFYADNSFGGKVLYTAMCGFDKGGKIIEVRTEQAK